MRGAIFVLSFAATCFGAQASSIVMLGGAPAATPSIIALGEPEAAVSDDKVAAIPKPPVPKSSGPAQSTMVIRGGVVGGLSADPSPASVQREPAPVAAAPQPAASTEQPAPAAGESAAATSAASDTSSPVTTNKPL